MRLHALTIAPVKTARPKDGETIVAAAVLYKGNTYSVPAPGRHCDIVYAMAKHCDLGPEAMQEQGFITSEGNWVRRKPALLIAEAAKQLIRKTHPLDTLFSEDVW